VVTFPASVLTASQAGVYPTIFGVATQRLTLTGVPPPSMLPPSYCLDLPASELDFHLTLDWLSYVSVLCIYIHIASAWLHRDQLKLGGGQAYDCSSD
jgi:hypothetical protein